VHRCACHHHPFEKWSQDDYYGMSAFFVRLGTKNSQEFGIFGREKVVYLKSTGEQTHPRKGGVVKSRPLDGVEMNDPIDRRVKLAEWMTAADNPFFAKNLVNRFGVRAAAMKPLGQRATNQPQRPCSTPWRRTSSSKYDLRHLLRTILSRAIASATIPATGPTRNVFYTRLREAPDGGAAGRRVDFAT
jgi:hypothetical protein